MLPTSGALDSTGLTYLPRIHIYRDTYISPPCSNPRSAPPPRRGVFCCGGFLEPFARSTAVSGRRLPIRRGPRCGPRRHCAGSSSVRVGVSGSDHAELRRCLVVGQYASASAAARSLPVLLSTRPWTSPCSPPRRTQGASSGWRSGGWPGLRPSRSRPFATRLGHAADGRREGGA
jgi:hypothetical protein